MKLHECRVSEATVEYSTAGSFGGQGFAGLRGVELDDAGERTGPDTTLLVKRLAAIVHRLNPAMPQPASTGAGGRGWWISTIRSTTIFWWCGN